MVKNYFKIAFRNLKKNKGFTAINIIGLAIGMAAAMLVMLWVNSEFSYDRFYSKTDRIYAVGNKDKWEDKTAIWFYTPKPMAATLKTEYPEIKNVTRVDLGTNFLLSNGEKKFSSEEGCFVDSAFLKIFDFTVLAGDANQALRSPTQIVLTRSLSNKLFGDESAVGQALKIDSMDIVTVGAVLDDIPDNSFMKDVTYLLPWTYMEKLGWADESWRNNSVQTFIELDSSANMSQFQQSIRGFLQRHAETTIENVVQPIRDQWLYSEYKRGKPTTSRIGIVHAFIAIAGFILLIAAINFMNLSTAQSEKRAKEVGVRKVIGAKKRNLIWQFMTESILVSIIAGVVALLIVLLALPTFSNLVSRELDLNFGNIYSWSIYISFVLFTGILAGSYPAFYLSSFIPIKVLKGRMVQLSNKLSIRKTLVIFQFCIAIILVISSTVLMEQIQYGHEREVGYEKKRLLNIRDQGSIYKHRDLIKNALIEQGIAAHVSRTSAPLTENNSTNPMEWEGKPIDDKTMFSRIAVDDDLVATAGLQIISGRDFDLQKFPTDSTAAVINEAALKVLNFSDPLGKRLRDGGKEFHIIGIIKDFVQESPFDPINPLVIQGAFSGTKTTNIKLNDNITTANAVAKIEKIFKEYNPDYPFEYNFVDEVYAAKFLETQQISKLSGLFTILTIFIACLGLFGLAAYMAENRTKEIGVRKLLGASVISITQMLSKEFVYLVLISCIVAFPLAYWASEKILNNYSYRINISWYIFLVAGVGAVIIAALTVSYQSIKAALANPVDSLRDE